MKPAPPVAMDRNRIPSLPDDKLRILMLTPIEPFPPHGGWQTVIYNDAKFLARRGHEIKILSIAYDAHAKPSDVADIGEAEYFAIARRPRWRQVLANMGKPLPYSVDRHVNHRLLSRAVELVRSWCPDVVLIEDVVMGWYAARLKREASVPIYLRSHNINTKIVERFCKTQRNPLLRFLGRRQWSKFDRYERSVWETFDGVSQISPVDAALAREMNPRVEQKMLYSGIDLDYFTPAAASTRQPDTIIHVGSVGAQTKTPGLVWFREQVYPLIKKRRPSARLEFVGRMPNPPPFDVTGDDVTATGYVDEVLPYLQKAAVFVVPLFVGGGIRIKILNALATENAIVSTPVGCEGIPVVDGEHLLTAESAEGFADCVCRLLEDEALRHRLGSQGRALATERFAWPTIAEELESHLRHAIEQNTRTSAVLRPASS